jgi:hypothetical protein
VVGRLGALDPLLLQGDEVEVRGMDNPIQRQKRSARREGGCSGQDHEGGRDAAEADTAGVFIEIAKDHRRPNGEPLQGGANRVQLTAASSAEQAKMHGDHPQRRRRVQIDDHRPARLMPR